ncbi:MAG: TRZ/ATZ family protein [Spirochaetaceae bacterium]|nr:MAG: TRZ/ATZ family protein [Spirochaetaceae bacterium]
MVGLHATEGEPRPLRSLRVPDEVPQFGALQAGDQVLLSGTILTARDAAHARLVALLESGQELPVELRNQTIYYTGPTPTPEGKIIGSCGPTTSGRMDGFTPTILRAGVRAMIGKGPRSAEVIAAMRETGAVYFYAFGGCGALYAQRVRSMELLAFEDLGPEAIYRLEIEAFPLVVAIDGSGASIF